MRIMLARQNGKMTRSKEELAKMNEIYMDESQRGWRFIKANLQSICELYGLDIDGDVLIIGDRKYFVHVLRGTVVEIKTKDGYYGE